MNDFAEKSDTQIPTQKHRLHAGTAPGNACWANYIPKEDELTPADHHEPEFPHAITLSRRKAKTFTRPRPHHMLPMRSKSAAARTPPETPSITMSDAEEGLYLSTDDVQLAMHTRKPTFPMASTNTLHAPTYPVMHSIRSPGPEVLAVEGEGVCEGSGGLQVEEPLYVDSDALCDLDGLPIRHEEVGAIRGDEVRFSLGWKFLIMFGWVAVCSFFLHCRWLVCCCCLDLNILKLERI